MNRQLTSFHGFGVSKIQIIILIAIHKKCLPQYCLLQCTDLGFFSFQRDLVVPLAQGFPEHRVLQEVFCLLSHPTQCPGHYQLQVFSLCCSKRFLLHDVLSASQNSHSTLILAAHWWVVQRSGGWSCVSSDSRGDTGTQHHPIANKLRHKCFCLFCFLQREFWANIYSDHRTV